MAIQLRRGDYADFDPSQLLDGELAVVLENDPDTEDGTGLYVGFGDDNVKRLLTSDETILVPIATNTSCGIVKPDGESITVDNEGTLHGASTVSPSSTVPEMDGTAAAGSSTAYARGDHRHPTDTTRASASDLSAHTSDTTAHVTAAERSTWNAKASTDTATQSANGLMSSADKTKLAGIGEKANGYYTTETVDGDEVLTLVYDLVDE